MRSYVEYKLYVLDNGNDHLFLYFISLLCSKLIRKFLFFGLVEFHNLARMSGTKTMGLTKNPKQRFLSFAGIRFLVMFKVLPSLTRLYLLPYLNYIMPSHSWNCFLIETILKDSDLFGVQMTKLETWWCFLYGRGLVQRMNSHARTSSLGPAFSFSVIL